MTFAARALPSGGFDNSFSMTPGENGIGGTGYQASFAGTAFGSVIPNPVNLYAGRLMHLLHNAGGGFPSLNVQTEVPFPISITVVDVYLGGVLHASLPRLVNGQAYFISGVGVTNPFTVGVPVAVRLVFR